MKGAMKGKTRKCSYAGRWILGERSDNRFEFLERYGSCRVVRSQEVPGTAEGAPRICGGLQGPLAAIV